MTIKITTKMAWQITWRITKVTAEEGGYGVEVEATGFVDVGSRSGSGADLTAACADLAAQFDDPALTNAIYAEAQKLMEGKQ